MKKILLSLMAALFFGPLMGCQNHDAASTVKPPEAQVQNFQGVIPCADCPGIQTTLSLRQGGRYSLSETWLGANNVNEKERGSWSRTANKLVLISEKGEKRYFHPLDSGELEMTDADGKTISTTLNYKLMPIAAEK